MLKNFLKLFIFTIFFTVVIYFINYNFFLVEQNNIEINIAEENYIDTTKKTLILNKIEKNKIVNYFKKINHYHIISTPEDFYNKITFFREDIKKILDNGIFKNKTKNLIINLESNKTDRRGNMRNRFINIYGLTKKRENEYLSVFIHEFGHYIDIYFFQKEVFLDVSDKFYKISWKQTKIKKINQNVADFVSGYAMTNKYEDFAETFNFYILHNKEFLKKLKKSKILKQKYDFFSDYLFKNKEFFASNFQVENYNNYYWDTTKIKFDKKKFFDYLGNLDK